MKEVAAFIGLLALGALILFSVSLPGAYILMLLLGAFSHVANMPAAALGFWPCYILVLIVTLVFGGGNVSNK